MKRFMPLRSNSRNLSPIFISFLCMPAPDLLVENIELDPSSHVGSDTGQYAFPFGQVLSAQPQPAGAVTAS